MGPGQAPIILRTRLFVSFFFRTLRVRRYHPMNEFLRGDWVMNAMMRWTGRLAVMVLATLTVSGCGGTGQIPIGGVGLSVLCPNVTGNEALAWDYYNGQVISFPNGRPPVPTGGVYGHPDFPLLGFTYPANWTPLEVRDAATQGVTVVRNDNQALWRLVFTTVPGVPDVRQIRDTEIQQVLNFYGFNGTADQIATVCLREGTAEQAPGTGIVTTASNIMLRSPGHTMIVAIQVTPFPAGLGRSSVTIRAMAAPTQEFGNRAFDSFIAIDWQMLVGDDVSSDRDLDGWLDQFDRAPDDPRVH